MKESSSANVLRGWGVLALGLGLGVGGCEYLESKGSAETIMARQEIVPYTQYSDMNTNGFVDVYHEVDGVKYFSVIDGRRPSE